MRVFFRFLSPIILLTACQNNAKEKKAGGVEPAAVYHDYRIWAEEEKEAATVMLQYRYGGEEGEALLLEEPSKVSLDGMELKPDSAKLTGVFYESIVPINEFRGNHTIVFRDARGKEHKTAFSFEPFTLAADLPEQLPMKPFAIQLANFPEERTRVQLVMIDTSYITPDVNEDIEVENGELRISEEMLANLFPGPITLEIYREEKKPLENVSRQGGRISITYGLRRQFQFLE